MTYFALWKTFWRMLITVSGSYNEPTEIMASKILFHDPINSWLIKLGSVPHCFLIHILFNMKAWQVKEVKQDLYAPFNVPAQRSQKCVCLIANSNTDSKRKLHRRHKTTVHLIKLEIQRVPLCVSFILQLFPTFKADCSHLQTLINEPF